MAAAINSCRKRFFWFKSLFDLATISGSYPDLDWDIVVSKARAYKANTILYAALLVTQTTIGLDLPDDVLPKLRVNPLRTILIRNMVRNLSRRFTLSELFVRSANATLDRKFSWPLFLTYATYRTDLLGSRFGRLYESWRNPPLPPMN